MKQRENTGCVIVRTFYKIPSSFEIILQRKRNTIKYNFRKHFIIISILCTCITVSGNKNITRFSYEPAVVSICMGQYVLVTTDGLQSWYLQSRWARTRRCASTTRFNFSYKNCQDVGAGRLSRRKSQAILTTCPVKYYYYDHFFSFKIRYYSDSVLQLSSLTRRVKNP